MGLDLRLLPFDADVDVVTFSHTILSCERRRELFEELLKLPSVEVPERFYSFTSREASCGESHYGVTRDTPYGEPLDYVRVKDLLAYSDHEGVTDNGKNRAIWAYLKCLPPENKVALYWC